MCVGLNAQLRLVNQQPPPNVPTTTALAERLILKACCGDSEQNCEEFQRPEEMFGIACCGSQPINTFEEICCENVIRRRRQPSSYIDRCCGNQTLAYDQTCCQGVVHNIPNGECCGFQAYPRNNVNVLCCNGVLNMNVEPGLVCCGQTPYDGGIRESCCGDKVHPKELFDGCCQIRAETTTPQTPVEKPALNPLVPQWREFNSKTHQCCDVPIERFSNTKCCYLRSKATGQFVPRSYDSSTSCCAYPYNEITPKNAEEKHENTDEHRRSQNEEVEAKPEIKSKSREQQIPQTIPQFPSTG
ncbi:galaxin [Ditylenchus destructor]|nr:galaxin [Ditylenchus destructor]